MTEAKKIWDKYGIWVIALITLICGFHTFHYLHTTESASEILSQLKDLKADTKELSGAYKRGYWLGGVAKLLFKIKSSLPMLIGLGILAGEFNYRTVFKPLFVAGKGLGKVAYFFVVILLLILYVFLIRYALPASDRLLGIDVISATAISIFSFIYSVGAYANSSFVQLQKLNFEKTKAELTALKAQINPHFLFNVLNNLYGSAIVEDSPKTADGIQQLSRIMRHVVEETKTARSPIDKEIEFINDYLELQQMRIPERDNININCKIDWDGEHYQLAPLLFIPYLENAFKYGISVNEPCFINVLFQINGGKLSFRCENSIIKKNDKLEQGTGTGLDNTQKRLALYYPGRHVLNVENDGNTFKVNAEIKL